MNRNKALNVNIFNRSLLVAVPIIDYSVTPIFQNNLSPIVINKFDKVLWILKSEL